MRTALSALEVVRPRSVAQALALMHAAGTNGRLTPLAGGTDLFVYLNAGTLTDRRYLDLSLLAPLRAIRAGKNGLRIGALATFDAIARHAATAGWPMLRQAARVIGAAQIQNRATLGGNIANASPAGDSLPVLLAYGAVVHAGSVRGERELPFGKLYTGYRRLALEPDELIVAVTLPAVRTRTRVLFRKVGTRAAQSISKVVFAGALRVSPNGAVDHARLAWGSVAATTLRSHAAEEALLGSRPSPALVAAARAALARDIAPIDDIRSEGEYRFAVAQAVLAQFLRTAHAGFRAR
ncbi:MAG TPA: FAD binding domain-containing protein [Candidatus Acidoferrales bacterium]|nr:FAD binding domain-containing protein [Candidatus Acidoferrales bacterium]